MNGWMDDNDDAMDVMGCDAKRFYNISFANFIYWILKLSQLRRTAGRGALLSSLGVFYLTN